MPAANRILDDHGELAGLADDDHSQYLNNARGDARYLALFGGLRSLHRTGSSYYYMPLLGTPAGSLLSISTGLLVVTPFFLASAITIDRLVIEVTTAAAGATVTPAIYTNSNGLPNALLVNSSALDASSTGFKEGTITATPLDPGAYWIGVLGLVAVATIRGNTGMSGGMIGGTLASVPGGLPASYFQSGLAALPSTWGGTGSTSVNAPRVLFRVQ